MDTLTLIIIQKEIEIKTDVKRDKQNREKIKEKEME